MLKCIASVNANVTGIEENAREVLRENGSARNGYFMLYTSFYVLFCLALAASVFHYGEIDIPDLKDYLEMKNIPMRKR